MKIHLSEKLLGIQPKVGRTTFIAINGRGGSGKSTFSKILAKLLHAEIVRTDDFSHWDNPFNWHADIINKVFQPIANGEKVISYQPTSWWDNHHPQPIHQTVTKIMILEGVGSSRKEIQEYISLSIFIDTPRDICLNRGIERDLQDAGKQKDEVSKMWQEWFTKEDEYLLHDNPKDRADIIIDGTKPFDKQIAL